MTASATGAGAATGTPAKRTPRGSPPCFVHVIAPGPFGGAESVVSTLAAGLAARDHDVRVVLTLDKTGPEPPVVERLRRSRASVTTLRLAKRAYRAERNTLADLIAASAPAILHTHGYRADIVGLSAARAAGAAIVSTAHGYTGGGPRNRFYEWLQRRAYVRFDAVVAVSRELESKLTASLRGRTPVSLIPNAWEPEGEALSRDHARRRLGLPADEFVVGWVGRLTREKGADLLLEAIASLGETDLTVSILGDGSQRRELEPRAAEAGVPVRWHGSIPDAWRLFRAFDLFVLSSRTEGTPMVLFEAMHARVPIVATRVGGVPDVLGEGAGWLLPPEAPHALAEAIRKARADPTGRRERARRARAQLSASYGLEPWLDAHEEMYARILASGGSA